MATTADIVDQIDALVNDQLANYGQRSGYDHNVNQQTCWHCGREWHGLRITERIEQMRQSGRFDESYRYADDDSETICEGSEFIGPIRHVPAPLVSPSRRIDDLINAGLAYALEALSAPGYRVAVEALFLGEEHPTPTPEV